MCSYLTKRGSTYYFRRTIPLELRPAFNGKSEFMQSLRTKDRGEAKRLIPARLIAFDKELSSVRSRLTAAAAVAMPPALKTQAQLAMERKWEDYDREQEELAELFNNAALDADLEIEELTPIMHAIEAGCEPEGSAQQIARAAYLLLSHKQWDANLDKQAALTRLAKLYNGNAPVAAEQDQPAANPGKGKILYLDTDILDRWAAERRPRQKTIDAHRAVARWFYERVGKTSVGEITRKQVIAFKDKLLEEGQSPQNINVKLGRLKTLLGWAVQNDLAGNNAADGISIVGAAAAPRKRQPFSLADLNAIFASPVYAEGQRPKRGRGEAAYWLPLLALFTGAREEELGQLRPSDIQKLSYPDTDGVNRSTWVLRITTLADEDEEENQLKNEESERLVPVHPELERLGFIRYVEGVRKAKHPRIFPLLTPGAYGRLTAKWGEWFGPYLRKECGISDRRKVFHSFRHAFKDYARMSRIAEPIQRQIMGHGGEDVADRYGRGYDIASLVSAMSSYRVPGLNLPEPAQ